MDKSITVAICTYNRYDVLGTAVESCLGQSHPKSDFEIIVVDNSPDPDLKRQYAEQFSYIDNLIYIDESTPGLSNARNVALERSKGKYIAYLDDDAIAEKDWLARLKEGFETISKNVGIVGGRIDPIWEVTRPNWLPTEFEGMFTVVNWGGSTRIAKPEEWFAGANIAFDVHALKQVGCFNTNLGRTGSQSLLSNEESAVCDAIEAAGYARVYAPHAQVRHLVGKERISREWMRKRQAWQAVSDFIADKDRSIRNPRDYWHGVAAFYASLPPRYRNSTGLFHDFDDPDLTAKQMGAVYNFNMLLLMGATNVDDYHYAV